MTNSLDHDQMQHSAVSDLGLQCLPRHVFLNTESKHGNLIKWNPTPHSDIILDLPLVFWKDPKVVTERQYRPGQAKRGLRACAKCTDSDSSHACTKSHLGICSPLIHSLDLMILLADSKGPDQTAWMCRLTWTFVVLIYLKTRLY